MLSNKIKISLITLATVFSTQALADTGFKVPVHYEVELVDGIDDYNGYSRFSRVIELGEGKHQVVLVFKDTFKEAKDTRVVQSVNPVVINIENLKKDQVLTFQYKLPSGIRQAEQFSRQQKITLTDTDGKVLAPSEASYFVLTSERGFALTRDYKAELLSLGKLYAPLDVPDAQRGITMTKYGVPTIKASGSGGSYSNPNQGLTMEPLSGNTSAMSTSAAGGGVVNSTSYNELVNMYNNADDATKLKFVKYVMSH
ncbi:hypothetical protein SAMN02910357_01901 [Succinivibrio dextrinosolvens]|uniref:DUF2057 family protein n=1 Tax=Succinivibrio dextrinosolvens TaxID=83771 RepID=UPI0008E4080C|nr:DUF2057 family protein [Succinivibrio dextrinosolvens]SFS79816.1 hypothetical protein SAMN02910357_01901 [Succinivibrio dextrinosolvens]